MLVLLAVAVVSCQKEPSTSGLHEDYLVYTDYDQQADFSDVETFYLPDSILVIGNADKTEYWKDAATSSGTIFSPSIFILFT